jgi:hypothetical protein
MTPEQLFSIANLVALVAWILLAVFPRRPAVTMVTGTAIPAVLAATYVVLVAAVWNQSAGGFGTLADVAILFANRWLLLAGWIHYLVFDLLVGHWEVRDARRRNIPHWIVLPSLALTFLFGPAGWLLYLILRTTRSR